MKWMYQISYEDVVTEFCGKQKGKKSFFFFVEVEAQLHATETRNIPKLRV